MRSNLKTLLVIDDEEVVRDAIALILEDSFQVLSAGSSEEAMKQLRKSSVDVILLDLMLGKENGMDLLSQVRTTIGNIPVIVLSGVRDVDTVVRAMKGGAVDYLTKPISREALRYSIERVLEQERSERTHMALRQEMDDRNPADEIIGASATIQSLKSMVEKLKGQEVNVLLIGGTGTGKEKFARLLYAQENDTRRPFVSVNCAAIPSNLLESTLFGHERGSFTGATERRIGKFELADGGDIFLDEITCLPLELQAKLLRTLEEKEVERIGASTPKKVSFRVIAASNEDIVQNVASGTFREDLFYRLNTVTLKIPSLNERREDILPLARYFLQKLRRTTESKSLSPDLEQILCRYDWPGNVRQLRNTIENMIIFSRGSVLTVTDFPSSLSSSPEGTITSVSQSFTDEAPIPESYDAAMNSLEKQLILRVLEKNRWSKTKTCNELGISRNTLYRKLATLQIQI